MRRRDFLSTAALTPAAAAGAVRDRAQLTPSTVRLNLRHTWTTVMSSSDYRDTFHVKYARNGVTGIGEGAPIVRYKESAATATKAVESVRELLESSNPAHFDRLLAGVFKRVPGEFAMKSAIDLALMDWNGKRLGVPVYRLFGLDPATAPATTFSIGIDTPEITKQKVREAEPYPLLKIKVGLASDEATIDAVRSVTKKPLLVDANEGWKTKEEAVEKINWLEKQGAFLIEQPIAAGRLDESHWIRQRVNIPVIADEECLHPEDVPRVAPYFDGVNVKLDKCGGIREAFRMIQLARAHGLKVMLGCMVSSSVAITAAAHLSPLVDWADLDGNLLVANDPYSGVKVREGKLILPNRPGLGLVRA